MEKKKKKKRKTHINIKFSGEIKRGSNVLKKFKKQKKVVPVN